VLSIIVTKSII